MTLEYFILETFRETQWFLFFGFEYWLPQVKQGGFFVRHRPADRRRNEKSAFSPLYLNSYGFQKYVAEFRIRLGRAPETLKTLKIL